MYLPVRECAWFYTEKGAAGEKGLQRQSSSNECKML